MIIIIHIDIKPRGHETSEKISVFALLHFSPPSVRITSKWNFTLRPCLFPYFLTATNKLMPSPASTQKYKHFVQWNKRFFIFTVWWKALMCNVEKNQFPKKASDKISFPSKLKFTFMFFHHHNRIVSYTSKTYHISNIPKIVLDRLRNFTGV